MDDRIRPGSRRKHDQEVDIIYNLNDAYFCMLAKHSDGKVPGRIWTIEAEIIGNNEKVKFGVRVSYTTPMNSNVIKPIYTVPVFVKKISQKCGIIDVARIDDSPKYIRTRDELLSLYNLLNNPNRSLPIVIVAENTETTQIGAAYLKGYLVDVDNLSKTIGLIAHVYGMSKECIDAWNDLFNDFNDNFGIMGGAVRTYNAPFDEEKDVANDHPYTSVNRIMATSCVNASGDELTAGNAFENILENRIIELMQRKRIDWKKQGHKFFFIANRELMKKKETASNDLKELISFYDEQIDELEKKIDEQENEILTAWQEKEDVEQLLEEEKRTTYQQNLRINGLIKQLSEKGVDEIVDLPNSYEEMEVWINQYFPGKIVLHSRAKRSLKDAEFSDVKLVYQCLMLLGNEYYMMKQGLISLDKCNSKCEELGVEIGGSIVDSRAGELGDTYYIDYHGKKVKLDMHIKKGKVTRDPKKCLRIYFFWDEDGQKVIIGSLPQHLQTRSS